MTSKDGALTKIHIVDDDQDFRGMLTNYLEQHNMHVRGADTGADMVRRLSEDDPDLILLDLRLSEEDGLDLLRLIRSDSDIPIIIMTGHHRDEIDRVVGLELGADDYVTKPFGLRELLARMRAVMRRRETGRTLPKGESGAQLGYSFEGWELSLKLHRLVNPSGETVPLTKGEYALLVAFLSAPARPLTREHLLQATRVHEDVFDRSIDVQVLRLRRKLEPDPSAPKAILTERGIGYRFTRAVTRL